MQTVNATLAACDTSFDSAYLTLFRGYRKVAAK